MTKALKCAAGPAPAQDCDLVASAWIAAERAARAAAECGDLCRLAGMDADDASEAIRAAVRAREAAEVAERATSALQSLAAKRMAWAATATAIEAEARVRAAIVEAMVAS